MSDQKSEVRQELAEKKDLTDDIVKKIEESIAQFQAQYAAGRTGGAKKPAREAVAV
jgi:uncharacterized protein (DUF305 family)